MEEAAVLIVGAGPSGLALGALLGRMNVKVRTLAVVLVCQCNECQVLTLDR